METMVDKFPDITKGMMLHAKYSDGAFYPAELVAWSGAKKRARAPMKVRYLGYGGEEWKAPEDLIGLERPTGVKLATPIRKAAGSPRGGPRQKPDDKSRELELQNLWERMRKLEEQQERTKATQMPLRSRNIESDLASDTAARFVREPEAAELDPSVPPKLPLGRSATAPARIDCQRVTLEHRLADLPFSLPQSVSPERFFTVLDYCVTLSRSFDESKKLAKSIAIGHAADLRRVCHLFEGQWSNTTNQVEISDATLEKCNGEYDSIGKFDEHDKFGNKAGAVIYYHDNRWKVNAKGIIDGSYDYCISSREPSPISGEWVSADESSRCLVKAALSFDELAKFAKDDGGLAIDGYSGALLAKVMFAAEKRYYPSKKCFRGGTRHRTSYGLARALSNTPGGGIVILVSEGGTVDIVKVFVGPDVYTYDGQRGTWQLIYHECADNDKKQENVRRLCEEGSAETKIDDLHEMLDKHIERYLSLLSRKKEYITNYVQMLKSCSEIVSEGAGDLTLIVIDRWCDACHGERVKIANEDNGVLLKCFKEFAFNVREQRHNFKFILHLLTAHGMSDKWSLAELKRLEKELIKVPHTDIEAYNQKQQALNALHDKPKKCTILISMQGDVIGAGFQLLHSESELWIRRESSGDLEAMLSQHSAKDGAGSTTSNASKRRPSTSSEDAIMLNAGLACAEAMWCEACSGGTVFVRSNNAMARAIIPTARDGEHHCSGLRAFSFATKSHTTQKEMIEFFQEKIIDEGIIMYRSAEALVRDGVKGEQIHGSKDGINWADAMVTAESSKVIRQLSEWQSEYFLPLDKFNKNWEEESSDVRESYLIGSDQVKQILHEKGWKVHKPQKTAFKWMYRVKKEDCKMLQTGSFETSFHQVQCLLVDDFLCMPKGDKDSEVYMVAAAIVRTEYADTFKVTIFDADISACNGVYKSVGWFDGYTKYRNEQGAIIYFNDGKWKLNKEDNTTMFVYCSSPNVDARPPSDSWSSEEGGTCTVKGTLHDADPGG